MKIRIIIFCFLFTQFAFSQNYSWFTKSIIREVVFNLSDDTFEGRKTGEKGGKKAGEYIYNYLNKMFKNSENVDIYMQEFSFQNSSFAK